MAEYNIFCNNFNVIKTNIKGKKIDLKTTINEEKFNSFIKEINGNLSNGVQQPSYYIEKNDLIITAGKEGISVNEEEFKKIILEKINTEVNNEEKVTLLDGLFEDFEVFSNISKHLTNANDEQRKEVESKSKICKRI